MFEKKIEESIHTNSRCLKLLFVSLAFFNLIVATFATYLDYCFGMVQSSAPKQHQSLLHKNSQKQLGEDYVLLSCMCSICVFYAQAFHKKKGLTNFPVSTTWFTVAEMQWFPFLQKKRPTNGVTLQIARPIFGTFMSNSKNIILSFFQWIT